MIVFFHFHRRSRSQRTEMAPYFLIMNTSSLNWRLNGGNRRSTSFRFFSDGKVHTIQNTVSSRRFPPLPPPSSPPAFIPLCNFCVSLSFQRDATLTHVSSTRTAVKPKSTAKLNRQSLGAHDVALFSRRLLHVLCPPPGRDDISSETSGGGEGARERVQSSKLKRTRFEGIRRSLKSPGFSSRWKKASDED